ncbi:hypothetical protein [Bradyrhizobium huanghuaihaiense]
MGQHFSGIDGLAPAQVLEASDAERFAIERFMATSDLELVDKYKFPKDEGQGQRLPAEIAGLIPANILKIDGGEIDWREAITRFLIWEGHPIKQAGSLADVAYALSELHSNRRGPKRKGPRLYPRGNFIWMTDGFKRKTTGFPYEEGDKYKANVGANAKLSEMVEVRVRAALGRVLKRDVTVSQMFTWWLQKNMPGARPDTLSKERYDTVATSLSTSKSTWAMRRLSIWAGARVSATSSGPRRGRSSRNRLTSIYPKSAMSREAPPACMCRLLSWSCGGTFRNATSTRLRSRYRGSGGTPSSI